MSSEDEALEKFQQALIEKDKATAEEAKKKRARDDFKFFKPHLELAREFLIAHKQKVQRVRDEIAAAENRGTELGQ